MRSATSSTTQQRSRERRAAIVGLFLCLLFLSASSLLAQTAAASSQVLDDLVRDYETASQNWANASKPIATTLLYSLFALEAVVTVLGYVLSRTGRPFAPFAKKIMLFGVFFAFISGFYYWLPKIISSFDQAGHQATGLYQTISPTRILDVGANQAVNVMSAVGGAGFWTNVAGAITATFVAVILIVSYALIAAKLCEVFALSYIVMSGCLLSLGFAGSRWTIQIAENYIVLAIRTGINIFCTYLIVGVGVDLSDKWTQLLAATKLDADGLTVLLRVAGGAMVFAFLALRIPNYVAHALTASGGFLHLGAVLRDDGEEGAA